MRRVIAIRPGCAARANDDCSPPACKPASAHAPASARLLQGRIQSLRLGVGDSQDSEVRGVAVMRQAVLPVCLAQLGGRIPGPPASTA